MIVYKITNIINNKLYFGVTTQLLKARWQQHKCNANKKSYHLYNVIKKYGFDNFSIEIVLKCNNKETMFLKEKELIKKYDTNNHEFGYNNSTGGESSRIGVRASKETKKKISEYQKLRKRKPHSIETKIKIGDANRGNIFSDDIKNKMSEARKGKPANNRKCVLLNDTDVFESITEASLQTGIGMTSIHNNLTGLSKSTKVGKWEYL